MWDKYLPQLQEDNDDGPTQHFIELHCCIHKIKIYCEVILLKLLMLSLEVDVRQWHRGLPLVNIFSLRDFHFIFHTYYKRMYHILLLLENNCSLNGHCDNAYLRFQESKHYVSDEEFESGSLQDAYKLDDFKEIYTQPFMKQIEDMIVLLNVMSKKFKDIDKHIVINNKASQNILVNGTTNDLSQNSTLNYIQLVTLPFMDQHPNNTIQFMHAYKNTI